MYDAIDEFTKGPLTLKVYHDESVSDPRKDFDHVGTMVCWHRRADLGDLTVNTEHYDSMAELIEEYAGKDGIVMPLWLYEHGGMTMSTGDGNPYTCEWDSGQVGFIFADRNTVAREFQHPRYDCVAEDCKFYTWGTDGWQARAAEHLYEHALETGHGITEVPIDQMVRECLEAEVEQYDQYLRGDVYGYVLKDDKDEQVDSCWGFYGYDYAIQEAKSVLDAEYNSLVEERAVTEKRATLEATGQIQ